MAEAPFLSWCARRRTLLSGVEKFVFIHTCLTDGAGKCIIDSKWHEPAVQGIKENENLPIYKAEW